MNTTFSLFEVLLTIGVTNGLIISLMIWFNKRCEPDKLLLSFILTVFNLLCLKITLFTSGLWQTTFFRYFPLPFELSVQPLIFLYTASLTQPGFRLKQKYFIHFVPFALSFAYSLYVYLAVQRATGLQDKDSIANHLSFNRVKEIEDFLSVFSAMIYWCFVLRLILRYRKWFYNSTSNTLLPNYNWLMNIIVLFGILFLMLGTNVALDYSISFGATHFFHWQILFIYLAVLIYYMGLKGYQQTANQLSYRDETGFPSIHSGITGERVQQDMLLKQGANTKREHNAAFADEKLRAAITAIIKVFSEEKIFLDPELDIQTLAKKIGLSPAVVSAAINSGFRKNFRNLVNEYRVAEVKARLLEPGSKQFSLLGIAYDCGFNSEASFYRIFKNIAGLSPKEYLFQQQPK